MQVINSKQLFVTAGIAGVLFVSTDANAADWAKRAKLIQPNSETAVAQLGNKLYVLGGYPSSRVTVNVGQEYNADTDSWRLISPMPKTLNHAMAVGLNGKVYIIGGQETAGGVRRTGAAKAKTKTKRRAFSPNSPDFDWRQTRTKLKGFGGGKRRAGVERIPAGYSNATYEWDPKTDKWAEKAPMPTKRSGGAAAVLDGKIYVAGGRTRETGADFAAYDPKTNSWEALPPVPTQRNHLGVVATAGKIWVVGGRYQPSFRAEQSPMLEAYDPKTRTWTRMKDMPKPRGGVNAIEANGCIHVFGGEGNPDASTGVWPDHDVYNPKTNSWTSLAPMPIPVHGVTGGAHINGWLHFPGGGTRIGGSSGSTFHQVVKATTDCG